MRPTRLAVLDPPPLSLAVAAGASAAASAAAPFTPGAPASAGASPGVLPVFSDKVPACEVLLRPLHRIMIHNMSANLGAVRTEDPEEYTVDQLAQASAVTVRNIRAHQSRGLLPAPKVRGRTGYYTQEHVARVRLIHEMQTDGFNLNAIKRILDGMPPGSAGEVLGFERALRTPW